MIAGIIGASGYAGAELIRLLSGHPGITGLRLASANHQGEAIDTIYPNFLEAGPGGEAAALPLRKFGGVLESPESLIAASDMVFGALPAGTGDFYAKACLDRGVSYIDLSADFRFDGDAETYNAWYVKPGGEGWRCPELRERSVYGLPELYRERIKCLAASGPVIIGNPGCYPTAVSLASFPALSSRPAASGNAGVRPAPAPGAVVIADAVSGVTGAGRDLGRSYHFPECSDSVSVYKAGAHRHTPEIARNLEVMAGRTVPLVFTPHLGPFNRGILATVYIPLEDLGRRSGPVRPRSAETVEKAEAFRLWYASFYKDEPFIRILPGEVNAATGRVRQSNYCDISVCLDQTGTVLVAVAAIDNMVKGAAGQAIQNMNIICGFDETAGLAAIPSLF